MDLVTFTEEILNRKRHFLCVVTPLSMARFLHSSVNVIFCKDKNSRSASNINVN